MIDIALNMSVPHLMAPVISTGMLFLGLLLFVFLFYRFKDNIYLTIVINGTLALLFVGSDMVITVFGELLNYTRLGVQFHRIEQLAGAFFLFGLPVILVNLLELNLRWKKVNIYISRAGLFAALVILIFAFIKPSLFISQSILQGAGGSVTWHVARGEEGILYMARDILLGLLITYSLICIIVDLTWHKNYKNVLLPFIGLIFTFAGAVDDTIYVHTGKYIGIFSDVFFSRFCLGITIFIIFVMASVINQFIDDVKNVKRAYSEKDSAYRIIRKSEKRFRQLAENINEVFLIYDCENKVFIYISPAYEKIWGKSCKSLYISPESWLDGVHYDDQEFVKNTIIEEKEKDRFDLEYRIITDDNTIKWIRDRGFRIRNKFGETYRIARTLEDITDRKKSENELVYIAYHDILTGLSNRTAFFETLNELLVRVSRDGQRIMSVLFIDLDNFKFINDTFGHDFGDRVIKSVAERLLNSLRKSDYVFRISGNEFAVILYRITNEIDASIVAKKIINEISNPFIIDNREVFINCSIGISLYPKDGDKAKFLIKNAHLALNEAKRDRNIYRFFNNDMNARAMERLRIENNLRYAISKDQLSIYYQPFVNMEGKITGMEALIRWKQPDEGFIVPNKFIPIAESTGQIIAIGDWVLRNACSQIKAWHEAGINGFRVAVNLSPLQLLDKNLVNKIENILKETGVSPSYLELEITESSVMKNPDDAINKINELYDKGIVFSIDDFGVAYSSLSYLKHFKIKHLKIDRSFIRDILQDEINTEIIRAIIAMSHNLGVNVIAEGVETEEQMQFLTSLRCDEMQGFLFSKPLPVEEFEVLLKKGKIILS